MKKYYFGLLLLYTTPVLGALDTTHVPLSIPYRNVTLLFIFLIAYYLISWYFYGRDPIKKTIMPQYRAPTDISAGIAYMLINKKRWSETATTATLLQLVENKFLSMSFHPQTKTFEFHKTGKRPISSEERLYETIDNKPLIIKSGQANEDLYGLNNRFEFIANKHLSSIYTANLKLVWPMAILFYFILPLCFPEYRSQWLSDIWTYLYMGEDISVFLLFCWLLGTIIYTLSRGKLSYRLLWATPVAFGLTLFTYICCHSLYVCFIMFCSVFIITFFGYLMGCPTSKGNRQIEYLEGLQMFLSTTKITYSEASFNTDLLPYAIALNAPYPDKEKHLDNLIHQNIQLYKDKIRTEKNQSF